jgi:hypothetical protein
MDSLQLRLDRRKSESTAAATAGPQGQPMVYFASQYDPAVVCVLVGKGSSGNPRKFIIMVYTWYIPDI